MKVALIGDASSPLFERLVADAAQRHTVSVITMDPPRRGVPGVDYFVYGRRIRSLPRALRYGIFAIPIRRRLRSAAPDVTHAHYAWGYGVAATLSQEHPRVVSVWGSDVLVSGSKSPIHRWITRRVLQSADAVCATSPHLATAVAQMTGVQATITPFGIDTAEFSRGEAPATFTIGMVKRLDENSGVGTLLDALALLHDRCPSADVRARIVGRHPAGTQWKRRAAELGIKDLVVWRDGVDVEQVPRELHQMSVFVQVSAYTEGYGVAVLEAQSCAIPVVVSSVGGLPDVVRANVTGLVIPPRDPQSLMRALEMLMKDDSLRHRMGESARAYVCENYDTDGLAAGFDSLYQHLGLM